MRGPRAPRTGSEEVWQGQRQQESSTDGRARRPGRQLGVLEMLGSFSPSQGSGSASEAPPRRGPPQPPRDPQTHKLAPARQQGPGPGSSLGAAHRQAQLPRGWGQAAELSAALPAPEPPQEVGGPWAARSGPALEAAQWEPYLCAGHRPGRGPGPRAGPASCWRHPSCGGRGEGPGGSV